MNLCHFTVIIQPLVCVTTVFRLSQLLVNVRERLFLINSQNKLTVTSDTTKPPSLSDLHQSAFVAKHTRDSGVLHFVLGTSFIHKICQNIIHPLIMFPTMQFSTVSGWMMMEDVQGRCWGG